MQRKPEVTVFVRHRDSCGFSGNESYPKCNCPKWLRYSLSGKQRRVTARTRTWGLAEEKASDLQRQLDAGLSGKPVASVEKQPTIAEAVETFLNQKLGSQISESRIRKLRHQLRQFEQFMSARSKFFPSEITRKDVIDFRGGWTWQSTTKQKAQQNLRGFLRSCCKENRIDLLDALNTIQLSEADEERLEPQPFSEKELTRLLEQVPVTFPVSDKAGRVTALIHCMASTGLAIRDTVQLKRDSVSGGWLRIKRQKTRRPVKQKLDAGLHHELLAVANGNPKYVFWNGTSKPTTAVTKWQADLRKLMEDAGLWIKGNVSHRFRDTAVDFWLGEGSSMTEVAAMLGDTVAVTEKHYASLQSKRFEERLAKMPTRSWSRFAPAGSANV
jgi:site-specific recombinase XerD